MEARNAFESYVYSLRNKMDEEAFAAALEEEDKAALKEAVDGALSWLDENQSADKEEFDAKRCDALHAPSSGRFAALRRQHNAAMCAFRRTELEGVAGPLVQKAMSGGAAGMGGADGGDPGMAGGGAEGGGDEPTVEEVD